MTSDAEIVVGIRGETAGGKRVERQLDNIDRAGKRTKSGQRELQQEFKKTDQTAKLLRNTMAALGVSFGLRELQQTVDTYTNIQNRLKLVTNNAQELTGVTKELFRISNETRTAFESSAEVYARVALATKELGISQRDTLDFTESLNQAVVLSGASAIEANAGLIQLSQGLASGTLRGDELRSVLEQLPSVADVIAKSLGVTRGQLREMGQDGKITAETVITAFAEAREELADKFAQTVPTIGQAFTVLKNNVIEFTGELDQATGASATLAQALIGLGENLETLTKILVIAAGAWVAYRGAALAATGATIIAAVAGNVVAFVQLAATVRSAAGAVALLNAAFLVGPGALVAVLGAVGAAAFVFRDELNASITATVAEIIILVDKLVEKLTYLFDFGTTGLGALYAKGAAKLGIVDEEALNEVLAQQGGARGRNATGLSADEIRAARDELLLGLGDNGDDAGSVSDRINEAAAAYGKTGDAIKAAADAQKELKNLIEDTSTEQETLLKRIDELEKLRAFAKTEEEIQAINRALEVANEQLKTASDTVPGLEDNVEKIRRETDRFANSAADAFGEFITGAKSAREALLDIVNDLQKLVLRETVTGPLSDIIKGVLGGSGGGSSSGGGIFSSIASGIGSFASGLFGFNSGGSMVLGGTGGIDQNVLSLNGVPIANTSRGETLSINPGNKGGGGGIVINQTLNVQTGVAETVAAEFATFMPVIEDKVKAGVREAQARGIE